jgi:hypothetical protein
MPIPVSVTENNTPGSSQLTRRTTEPWWVNFSALPNKSTSSNGLQIGINNIVRKGPWVFEFTGPPAHAKIIDSYQAKFETRTQKLTWLDKEKENEIILKKDNDQEVDFNTKSFDKKTQTTTLCKLIK